MGAWGVLAFDNDGANDWASGLDQAKGISLIVSALAAADKNSGYLEAPDACNALAACEVLARLQGNFGYQNPYTAKVDEWVKQHPMSVSRDLIALAQSAIDRVLGDRSELRELWEEGDAREWIKSVDDLRARLGAA